LRPDGDFPNCGKKMGVVMIVAPSAGDLMGTSQTVKRKRV